MWIATVFSQMVLVFYDFFQNYLYRFYFLNIELVENLALMFFPLKHFGFL